MIFQRESEKSEVLAEARGHVLFGNRELPVAIPGMAVRLKLLGVVERSQNGRLLRKPVRMNGSYIGESMRRVKK
jgi:hypothetical protein